ncbi:MAG: hypothetical protein ACOYM3_11365 [Terrimicrobiaceae bacterium]
MNNPKFLRLIKKWHPDTTIDIRRKSLFEEMTKVILRANDEGDDAVLEQIERMGEGYLQIAQERAAEEEEDRRSDLEVREAYRRFMRMQNEEESRGAWADAYPIHPLRRNYVTELLGLLNPYFLPFTAGAWSKNGRLCNLWAIGNGAAWSYVWWILWGLIGKFETTTLAAAHAHDGGVGLLFVLIKGLMILSILPVAIPLGLLSAFAALGVGIAWLGAWVLGHILGFFHPWLVHVPYAAAAVVLLIAAWEALGNGLEDF